MRGKTDSKSRIESQSISRNGLIHKSITKFIFIIAFFFPKCKAGTYSHIHKRFNFIAFIKEMAIIDEKWNSLSNFKTGFIAQPEPNKVSFINLHSIYEYTRNPYISPIFGFG